MKKIPAYRRPEPRSAESTSDIRAHYFNDNDLAFINILNKLLLSVGIFSLFLSLLIATFMARRISRPISRVISTAQMISKGYFQDRISEKSSTREISQLTETINDLAETLEKHERLQKRLNREVRRNKDPLSDAAKPLEA